MRDFDQKIRQWEAVLREREREKDVSVTDTSSQTHAYKIIGNSHMAGATASTTEEERC
jgi:hypothetical protein